MNGQPSAETLLRHANFVRAVSRSLLRDRDAAEDNVQQTWLTALEHPPAPGGNMRSWLGTVARNLAFRRHRTSRRRAAREQRTARSGRAPAVDSVAADLELQRAVVAAVTALPEPYRTAVVMRYFHDRGPKEIGAMTGVSPNTVKTRLRRALERLRRELAGTCGKAWAVGLAGWLARPAAGGVFMNAKVTAVALVLCVLGTGAVVWNMTGDADKPRSRAEQARERGVETPVDSEVPASDGPDDLAGKGGTTGRDGHGPFETTITVTGSGESRGKPPAGADKRKRPLRGAPVKGPPPVAGVVTGVVRLAGGAEPSGVKVILRPKDGPKRETKTDPAGGFRFDNVDPGRYTLSVRHPGHARQYFPFDVPEDKGAGPFDLLLNKGGAIKVSVKGPYGAPIEGEMVSVHPNAARGVSFGGGTDRNGEVLIDNLLPGAYDVKNRKGAMSVANVMPGKTTEVVFRLACGIRGTVTGPDGKPLANAIVRLNPVKFDKGYRTVKGRTDKDGRYELDGFPEGEYDLRVQVITKEESYVASTGKVLVLTGQVLEHPVRIEATRLLGKITVGDAGTAPEKRMQVQAVPVEHGDDGKFKTLGAPLTAFADAEGRYRFVGIKPALYRLWVPPLHGYAEITQIYDFSAGGEQRVDFKLRKMQLGTVILQVLEPDGSPASGVTFWLVRPKDGWTHNVHPKGVGPGLFQLQLEVGKRVLTVARAGIVEPRLELDVQAGKQLRRTVKLELKE